MSTNYPSLMQKVKCCFCDMELLEMNYSVHLQRKHSQVNSANKRSTKQKSIEAFVQPQIKHENRNIGTISENSEDGSIFSESSVSRSNKSLKVLDDSWKPNLSENSEMLVSMMPMKIFNIVRNLLKS